MAFRPHPKGRIMNPKPHDETTRHSILNGTLHLALDMDGTLYKGSTLFAAAKPFMECLKTHGITYTFFTNNSSRSADEHVDNLADLGIEARVEQIRTSAHATVDYLKLNYPGVKSLFVVGTPGLRAELYQAGYRLTRAKPELIIVGFDPSLSYTDLCKAAYWIDRGLDYVATHPDFVCPTDQPTLVLDCGALCAAIEAATGRAPVATMGKPHPIMIEGILKRRQLSHSQLMVVGDRLYTDIAMANAVGVHSALVLTGEATRADMANSPFQPDFVFQSVAELGEALTESFRSTQQR